MDSKGTSVIIFIAMVVVFIVGKYHGAQGRSTLSNEVDIELEKQLKMLNKPPIKTILTEYGDILDCIDIYKQPALDHPLLKNHNIQMRLDLAQEETTDEINVSHVKGSESSFVVSNEKCPSGTIPIRRTKKEELLNAKYLSKIIKSYNQENGGHLNYHVVSVEPFDKDKPLYGAKGHISTANPMVESDQISTAQLWVQNGPPQELNSIEFGWAVFPKIFGDNRTRLFGYWTADNYGDTGCFNMLCRGFVQIDPRVSLGAGVTPISEYGGQQYAMKAIVFREPKLGDWRLSINDIYIGYWPNELFTHLSKNALVVKYGAAAGAYSNMRPSPQMGNGHFPTDFSKSSYIRSMKVIPNENGDFVDFDPSRVKLEEDKTLDCYLLIFSGHVDDFYELATLFGGPGGGGCPSKP